MATKTYIGKRITTKNQIGYFFLYDDDKTEKGTLKNPLRAIGEIIDIDTGKVIDRASEEQIALWTIEELAAKDRFNQNRASQKMTKDNKVLEFIEYIKGLKLSKYEKSKIISAIMNAIQL